MNRLRVLVVVLPLALLGCKKELICPVGQSACHGACVDLGSDAANCGACGIACGARSVCAAGSCECAAGATACGAACVDLSSDPAHCGACDAACGGATPACATEATTTCVATCPAGLDACGLACVDRQGDRFNCGGCGVACPAGQACRAGACHADLQVACGATGELRPVDADLSPAGPGRPVGYFTTALAVLDGAVYATSGFPATVDLVPLDPAVTLPSSKIVLGGNDLEGIAAHDNVLFVANAGTGTVVILAADGTTLDEVPMPGQQAGPNPRSIAFVGSRAYVALGGSNASSGQAVAVLDLAGLPACVAEASPAACGAGGGCAAGRHCIDGACRLPCATLARTIDLAAVPGAADAPGAPFPSQALAVGRKVYVTLGNLKYVDFGGGFAGWFQPAGSGRLAVIDTAAAEAVSVVDLGPGCGNPGGLSAVGTTLWVACGSLSFSTEWPGRVLPVSISGAPAVGAALDPSPLVPNGVVICGGVGYLPDMNSGSIRAFDPATRALGDAVEVCPLSAGPSPFAYVGAIACSP